ncbi:MAG: putative rane protein [Rariglobus sp.]|jgi:hypothetical protein|nr:putative rane protein [Rariglobus sp.]
MSSPAHEGNRTVLRAGGVVAVIVGGLFLLVGGIDFFSAFGTFHSPTKFWCFFVGIPLLALGANLLRMGYLGAVSRYMAAETVPVIRDSAVEVAEGLRPTVRGIVSDLRASGQPDAPAGDPATRLARLEKLRSDGLISEAEHADQRARILREL